MQITCKKGWQRPGLFFLQRGENKMLVDELNRFRNKLAVPAVFGGVVNAKGNLELEVAGVRKRGFPEQAVISDRIHIGSCCKMLTAALFGTYVAEQKADWKMPVTELFPDLSRSIAAGWQQQSVADLLYCLSGMTANPPRRILHSGHTDTRSLPTQRTGLAELAFSNPPHRPGHFVYSNMSYIVMGAAIDRLAGTSFEAELDTRLLQPLGITSAGYGPPPETWGHAPGIYLGGLALFKGRPADPTESKSDNPPVLSSAGTLHLNSMDWARLLRLFLADDNSGVVDSQVIEHILRMPKHKGARMGMGWAPVINDGLSYGAQGSNVRWSATALLDDARQRVAFVVCNDGRSSVLRHSVALAHQLLL